MSDTCCGEGSGACEVEGNRQFNTRKVKLQNSVSLDDGGYKVVYSLMRSVLCLGSRSKKSKDEHKRTTLLCGFENPSRNKKVLT